MIQDFPKSIKITVCYDPVLEAITGKGKEEMMANKGASFQFLLYCIFTSYPKITERYPPGKLGMLLNGRPPELFDILKDSDELVFKIYK